MKADPGRSLRSQYDTERMKKMEEEKKDIDLEILETRKKIAENEQLIEDAENALDAAIECLEEELAEACADEQF